MQIKYTRQFQLWKCLLIPFTLIIFHCNGALCNSSQTPTAIKNLDISNGVWFGTINKDKVIIEFRENDINENNHFNNYFL
jgi:hypothetical protein